MTNKQEWLYTEDGPELQKTGKSSKAAIASGARVNRWYFFSPWIIWVITIFYCFYLGGNWGAIGFLLIVFGPVPITMLNIKTFKKLYFKPVKSKK